MHRGRPGGVAEQIGDRIGAVALDLRQVGAAVADDAARQLLALGADDEHGVAALEIALDGDDAGRQQAPAPFAQARAPRPRPP